MEPNDAIYPSLRDRAVLVTGGASGIGAAIVAHFCAQGARVTSIDIADDAAAALAVRIAAAGHPRPQYPSCRRDRHRRLAGRDPRRRTVPCAGQQRRP